MITAKNGLKLYLKSQTVDNARANVLLVHGYAEHSGRYTSFFDNLRSNGLNTFVYDHQGHGKSEGRTAYVNRFSDYVDDLKVVIDQIDDSLPIVLFCHSMGGLIVANYLIQHDHRKVKACIFSAPAVMIPADLSPFLQKISGFMSWLVPKLKTVKLDSSGISSDPNEVKIYNEDPLIYRGGTYARTGAEIIKTQKWVQTQFDKIKVPFLLLQGSADKIAEPKGAELLYEKSSSDDKEFLRYKDYYHEVLREPGHEEIENTIAKWILDRV